MFPVNAELYNRGDSDSYNTATACLTPTTMTVDSELAVSLYLDIYGEILPFLDLWDAVSFLQASLGARWC